MFRATLRNALAVMALAAASSAAPAVELSFKLETPPGITWADLPQGPVLVTADGMTIYKTLPKDVGTWGNAARQTEVVGTCVFQCASEWPPLKAPADAKPIGDFTIVQGEGGVRQWAYKGIALQTFIFDKKPGETKGQDTYAFNGPRIPIGEAAWVESNIPPMKPAPAPAPSAARPSAVKIKQGIGGDRFFTDAGGMILYTFVGSNDGRCGAACGDVWKGVSAGALSRPVGDWSVIAQGDGTRLWAFKRKPVYTYANDNVPGEPLADVTNGKWQAAIEYKAPLPPEVTVRVTETFPVYAEKATGRTLYFAGYRNRAYEYLSFNKPGVLYGTILCYNTCAKTYPPLLASDDAKPMGEWWIITRADGKKQWAFRGIPVYTYYADEPGRAVAATSMNRTWTEVPANLPPFIEEAF